MNKRALNIQFLLADRARSKVNLASSRLISLYHPSQTEIEALATKLCSSFPIVKDFKERQLKRARKQMLETSKKAVKEGSMSGLQNAEK